MGNVVVGAGGEGALIEPQDETGVALQEAADLCGVLVGPQGAGAVDEQAAGGDEVGGLGEKGSLEREEAGEGVGGLVEAGFGSAGEDAGVGTGHVEEDAVVGDGLGGQLGGDSDVDELAGVEEVLETLAASGVGVYGVDVACGTEEVAEVKGFGAVSAAAVEEALVGLDVEQGGDGCGGGVLDLGEAAFGEGSEVLATGGLKDDQAGLGVGAAGGDWGWERGEGGGEIGESVVGVEADDGGGREVGMCGDGGGGFGAEFGDESGGDGAGQPVAEFPLFWQGQRGGDVGSRLAGEVAEDGVDHSGGFGPAEAAALLDGLVDGDGRGDVGEAGELPGGEDEDFLDEGVDGFEGAARVVCDAPAEGEQALDSADVEGFCEGGVGVGVCGGGRVRAWDEAGLPAGEVGVVETE